MLFSLSRAGPCYWIVRPGHGATKPDVVAKVSVVFCHCQHWWNTALTKVITAQYRQSRHTDWLIREATGNEVHPSAMNQSAPQCYEPKCAPVLWTKVRPSAMNQEDDFSLLNSGTAYSEAQKAAYVLQNRIVTLSWHTEYVHPYQVVITSSMT